MRCKILILDKDERGIDYGYLVAGSDVLVEEIQLKVNEIINEFEENNFEWFVSDVVNKLPIEWKCSYEDDINEDFKIFI